MSTTRTCETCRHPLGVEIVREREITWRETGETTAAVVRLRRCCECDHAQGTVEVPLTDVAHAATFDAWRLLLETRGALRSE